MRLGFFIGFLIGAAAASVIARQPPANEDALLMTGVERPTTARGGLVARLRARVREATRAAKEEAAHKEDEMRDEFESATHKH